MSGTKSTLFSDLSSGLMPFPSALAGNLALANNLIMQNRRQACLQKRVQPLNL